MQYNAKIFPLSLPHPDMYSNQVHKHTFKCTKRGETTCRFNILYWSINSTQILLPLTIDDTRRPKLQSIGKILKKLLEKKYYNSLEGF